MRVVMTSDMLDEGAQYLFRLLGDGIWDRFPEMTKQRTRDRVVRLCQTMGIDIIVEDDQNERSTDGIRPHLPMTPERIALAKRIAEDHQASLRESGEPSAEQQLIIDGIVGGKLTP